MAIKTLDDLDLTPPDNYVDQQIWLARNFGILQGVVRINLFKRRHFFLENPIANDDIFFFYTDIAVIIIELVFVLVGSVNATVFIDYGADRSVLATSIIDAGTVVSNTTTGQIITSFDNPNIPANSFVVVKVLAISGTPDQLNITLKS